MVRSPNRTPSPPSQIHHPALLPIPTSGLVESVAGAAHYSGTRLEPSGHRRRRSSYDANELHTELKPNHRRILEDLGELYCCQPTLEILERSWNENAEFQDRWMKCKGFGEYAAQWFAMPKLFSSSTTDSMRVMSSTHEPNRLVFRQSRTYTFRGFSRKKTIDSIVIVDLDEDDKIVALADLWEGKDLPVRFGAEYLRMLNAKLTSWLVSIPKPHEHAR